LQLYVPSAGLSATIDTVGNLGLGVAPSAWVSTARVFEIGTTGSFANSGANDTAISDNRYFNGTNNIYKTTNPATIYSLASGQHRWYTAASGTAGNTISFTQAMTLDSGGNFLLGSTARISTERAIFASNATNNILAYQASAGGYNFTSYAINNNGTYYHCNFSEAGTTRGSITSNGTSTTYGVTSDYRLKTVIGAVTGQGARIDALKPISYEWKNGALQDRGFLAHEFQIIYPNSVTGTKDALDKDGKPVYQAMQASTSEVIADLVAEIQSLRQRLSAANL
jgi:hypothetical protein